MTNASDSAYPEIITEEVAACMGGGYMPDTYSTGGLTKREYFAAMAMQGLLASEYHNHSGLDPVIQAVKHADALIEALNKETK